MLLRHVVPCNGIAVFAYDVQSNLMTARCAAGPFAARLRHLHCRMGQGPVGWAAVNRRMVANSASMIEPPGGLDPAPLNWTLTMPLVNEGQLAAVLAVYSDAPFLDDQARLVELLSPHLIATFAAVEERHESSAPFDARAPRQASEFKVVRGGLPVPASR
jgi:GAF domain-containing protein